VSQSPNPSPAAIREAREQADLTQTEAAALVHTTCRTWQQWEAGDRKMHPAFWELFQIKAR
jgi:DNA-binding transcriptional regulator YiaG